MAPPKNSEKAAGSTVVPPLTNIAAGARVASIRSRLPQLKASRWSRTTAPGVYAAGDCTGVLALASVAAMQGRIAMYHFLGDAVAPLNLKTVSANVFTDPEIATVGYSQADVDSGKIDARVVKLPLLRNPRAKMQGIRDGFVKIFCRPGTGIVVGGVVPPQDYEALKQAGAEAIFPPGTVIAEAAEELVKSLNRRLGHERAAAE